jgi:hypothetical protein
MRWLSKIGGVVSVDVMGIGFTFRADEFVAAPLLSREFEGRIQRDVPALKALIKEVTLGSHARG